MSHYITQIEIEHVRHLSNIVIELNKAKRSNLLLTGKNGSGKTSVLLALKKYLSAITDGKLHDIENAYPFCIRNEEENMRTARNENERYEAERRYEHYCRVLKAYKDGLNVKFNEKDGLEGRYKNGEYILAFYSADRKTGIIKQSGVEDIVLNTNYSLDSSPGDVLLKYLVHLKTQQSYARNENDMEVVAMLDEWFERFVTALRRLLDNQSIQIKYDYKNYNFEIIEDGRNAFGLDQLSDGYSAAIQIMSDLIMRMEQNWLKKGKLSSYDMEGIVIIDELETHLHIAMQKTILPFLTSFFPNIQFIVSTHSPYILNSIENCVIYDLEKKIRIEDMSNYSVEGIVEGYFGIDLYSKILWDKFKRYKELVELVDPTEEERAERGKLRIEFKQLSGDLSKEIKDAFEDIETKRKWLESE